MPVENGIQAQIHPAGFRFLSRELSGSTWALKPTDVQLEWECYAIAIAEANLELEFGRVDIQSSFNRLELDAEVVSAVGRDMHIDARSPGGVSLCVPFQGAITELAVRDARLTGDLFPQIYRDTIDITFLEPLELDADATVDFTSIPNFVEDGLLLFLEGALLNYAETELEEELPALLASLTVDGFLYQTEFAGFEFGVTPSLVSNSEEGLYAAANIDFGGDGGPGRIFNLEPRGTSHVAVGLTEAIIEELAVAAWAQGLITPDSETTTTLLSDLLTGLGLGEGLAAQIGVNVAPKVEITGEGIRLRLPKTAVSLDSEGQTLLDLEVDLVGLLELKVERGSLLVTAHDLTANITRLDASRLLEDGPENLEAFLEGWAIRAAISAIDNLEIYQSHFEALGYVLRIDETAYEDQGVLAWATLFAEDDPAVDRTPPDTRGNVKLEGNVLRATFEGSDDRPGPLVYSYRINGGSWSSWSPETEAVVNLPEGDTRFEVKARDSWHNEDPTPAGGTVTYAVPRRRCGCAAGPSGWGAVGLLGVFGLWSVRRRQR